MVGNTEGDTSKIGIKNEIRVSNIAWLPGVFNRSDGLGNILPRLQDVTGLSTDISTTEMLQVS